MFFQRISRLPPKIKTSSNDPGSTSPKTSSKSPELPPTLILLCRLIAFIDLTAGQQGATTQWGRDDDDEVDADVDIVCAWRRRRPDTPDYTHRDTHTCTPICCYSIAPFVFRHIVVSHRRAHHHYLHHRNHIFVVIIICFGGINISNSLWMMRPSAGSKDFSVRLNRFYL